MNKRILVTGGAGFIGSNIVASLERQGFDVLVCDRLRQGGKWKNLSGRRLFDFIQPEHLIDFLEQDNQGLHAVVHMGAISATTVIDGDQVIQNNFKLSVDLWNWCTKHSVRYIYASSAATYGSGENGFLDNFKSSDLSMLKPLNLYGWSKHLFDRWVVSVVESGGKTPPQWVGLKFFNVYGPNEYHKGTMRSVISQLYDTISSGGAPKLFKSHRADYSDGGQLRDFIYVKDCVKVIDWLLNNIEVSGIYNIGTGHARSFYDLAKTTLDAMDVNSSIEFIDMPEAIRDKYQYFTQADLRNLRSAGYQESFCSLEEGIGDYVKGYLLKDSQYL